MVNYIFGSVGFLPLRYEASFTGGGSGVLPNIN